MFEKTNPNGFAIEGDRLRGTFRFGMSIEGVVHKDFEMRDSSVEDLLAAEMEADVSKPMNFNTEVMARQLVRVGSFEGPFTVGMLTRLRKVDWRLLRAAQAELDALGEEGPASAPAS